jgi:hypothetical protein
VSFPPHSGLVIRHSDVWKREFDAGQDKGNKYRPCAIVLTVLDDDGRQIVAPRLRARSPTHRRDRVGATENRIGPKRSLDQQVFRATSA